MYTNSTFYDRATGEVVQLPKEESQPLIDRAQNELNMSDKIIEGDLLRFSESNKIKTGEVKTVIKEERRVLSNLSLFFYFLPYNYLYSLTLKLHNLYQIFT